MEGGRAGGENVGKISFTRYGECSGRSVREDRCDFGRSRNKIR